MDTLVQYAGYLSLAVTAAVAALAVIAPVTKTEADNKVLAALRFVESMILKVLLPGRSVK